MISITNLGMFYHSKTLFAQANINFSSGKRYGLVGANGTGKSTLLRILSGSERPMDGSVTIPRGTRIGVLKQDHFEGEKTHVLDVVLQGNPRLWLALEEKETLLASGAEGEEAGHRLGQLEMVIAEEEGYQAESFAQELLSGLGIADEYHKGPMSALSGGFRSRVLLAQVLFQKPDVLLLDEPTNHLDIVSIVWMERFLKEQFQGTLIFSSHDYDFLNGVTTHIIDVDYEELRVYTGNYDKFVAAKVLAEEQKLKEVQNTEKKIAEMQAFVDRFRAKASKARQAQSKAKQIDKMEIPDVKKSSRISPHIKFKPRRPSGRLALSCKGLCKSFGKLSVLKNINFEVERGEKIAIIGPNGIGKSTLLKLLLGELEADEGSFKWGHETHISYFAQNHHEQLYGTTEESIESAQQMTVYDWLHGSAPGESIGAIRSILGQVIFSGDDALKKLTALSGGEAARLLFARIMLEKNNVLVFDEPTNHLDLEGLEALAKALEAYEGTVLVVSHDRHFVSRVGTRILELIPEGSKDYHGTYADYLARLGDDYLGSASAHAPSQMRKAEKTSEAAPDTSSPQFIRAERKRMKRRALKLKKQVSELEKQIEETESQLSKIDRQFEQKNFFKKSSSQKVQELQTSRKKHQKTLSEISTQWETLSEELELTQSFLGTS